jgi:PQQ-dependent dehydrogenase (s-GDH family)
MLSRKFHLSASVAAIVAGTTLSAGGAFAQQSPQDVVEAEFPFEKTVLVEGLSAPHDINIGADDQLWVTERIGKRLIRVAPETGEIKIVHEFDIPDVVEGAQSGVMGFAFHPDFGNGTDQIFVVHTYEDQDRTDPTRPDEADPYHRLFQKVVRLDWDAETETVTGVTDVLTGIPANNDHNSGRMVFGQDGKIYLTVGDQGHNQLVNYIRPIESQRLPTEAELADEDYIAYQGKVLRLNTDGSIPEDNPTLDGVQSHVFTLGHRNAQGIAVGPDGTIYANEHGPSSDDEINVIVAGSNYGWPHVAGFADDSHYAYGNWSAASVDPSTLTFTQPEEGFPEEVSVELETEWAGLADMKTPLATLFTVGADEEYDFSYFARPTVGPSAIEYYESDAVAELSGRLLSTAMKHGSIYTIDPTATGDDATFTRYYLGQNRLRDLAISDDGETIYLVTDSSGGVLDADGEGVSEIENPGAILVYTAR